MGPVTGTGTAADPLTFRPDHIVLPPASPHTGTSLTRAPEREYATAEEEWSVAKESAWNWLLDKFTILNPGAQRLLSPWRYAEPPANTSHGRAYELRESYEAMQQFLNVAEMAFGIVSPLIVESAMANGLPSRFAAFLQRLGADTAGTLVVGPATVAEVREAETIIQKVTGEAASQAQIRDYIAYKRAYQAERAELAIDGAPFEGFNEHIFQWQGKRGDVNIGMLRGSRAKDAEAANKLLGIDSPGPDWVWHHHPDFGRMVLIPRDVHDQVRHWGGVAIWKRLFGVDYP
ncbi:HNH endonuclease [Streptomyces flaveus]|uniref:HNH endonuclease signature motif containing protein n=1 Tax=Streptomyces flaveus TaxID=66370 RepID=UPI00332BDDFE